MPLVLAVSGSDGFGIGLVVTALGVGFRHGIDWDHIAALSDITGSQTNGRRSMFLATFYALGHALVVFVLGVLAIVLSAQVPAWLDATMGRIVGVTLLALGVYVLVSLLRQGRDFRMRSRWMLVFAAVRRVASWNATRRTGARDHIMVITHEHEHPVGEHHDDEHDHPHTPIVAGATVGGPSSRTTSAWPAPHSHLHRHVGTVPDDPFPRYGQRTAFAVGALHGIGAETPTQILLFLAAAHAGGGGVGVVLLICFLAGLLLSNTAVALTASFGYLGASRRSWIYATVSVVTAAFSLVVGSLFLLGQTPLLPALTGG